MALSRKAQAFAALAAQRKQAPIAAPIAAQRPVLPLPLHWRPSYLAYAVERALATAPIGDPQIQARIRAIYGNAQMATQTAQPAQAVAPAAHSAAHSGSAPAGLQDEIAQKVAARMMAMQAGHGITQIPDPRNPSQRLDLDPDQVAFISRALEGGSLVLTGPAGAGKTAALSGFAMGWLAKQKKARGYIPGYDYKIPCAKREQYLGRMDDAYAVRAPAIYFGAFSNKAAAVLAQKLLANPELRAAGFGPNIGTLHALLEFQPTETWSHVQEKLVWRQLPQRTRTTPLHGLDCLVIDEASCIGASDTDDLDAAQIWTWVYDALVHGTQVVLVGDINQLPPVGGKSILAHGLARLPVCPLRFFHRQALDSPIISAAHEILAGSLPLEVRKSAEGDVYAPAFWSQAEQAKYGAKGKEAAAQHEWLQARLRAWIAQGAFVPGQDMILCPMNREDNSHLAQKYKRKAGGGRSQFAHQNYVSAKTINRIVGTILAQTEQRPVYTVTAGFETLHLTVGERVLVRSQEGTVVAVRENPAYTEVVDAPVVGQSYFTRAVQRVEVRKAWWMEQAQHDGPVDGDAALEAMLASYSAEEHARAEREINAKLALAEKVDDEDSVYTRAASHIIEIQLDNDEEGYLTTMSSAGDFQPQIFGLGYAMTVHKAQGSEWRRVYVLLHDCHRIMASRELLYTAVTRARNGCVLLGDSAVYLSSVNTPRLVGDTLEEKIASFIGRDDLPNVDMSKMA